jgi:hypothetical protein
LLAWLRFVAQFELGASERGCAFANARRSSCLNLIVLPGG